MSKLKTIYSVIFQAGNPLDEPVILGSFETRPEAQEHLDRQKGFNVLKTANFYVRENKLLYENKFQYRMEIKLGFRSDNEPDKLEFFSPEIEKLEQVKDCLQDIYIKYWRIYEDDEIVKEFINP